jgi:hypothetical protein
MKSILIRLLAIACLAATLGASSTVATAQAADAKKPPLYTYVSSWAIPRAHWADMDKARSPTNKILDQSLAAGTILGYGDEEIIVHQEDGVTHAGWWVANSLAGVLGALDAIYKSGGATSAALQSATKHSDDLYVSHFYGWRPGRVKDAYIHGAAYKLKADSPDNAVETISKSLIVPLFEKLLADGTVTAWQVAEQSIHTADPQLFFVFFITPRAEGLDKLNAALQEAFSANALISPTLSSMVDSSPHRDTLSRGDATLK